jgi:AraC-like DNA-binding protein
VFTDILAAGQSYAEAMAALYRGNREQQAADAESGAGPDVTEGAGEPQPETARALWLPDSAANELRRYLEAADLASIRTTLSRMNEDLTASGSPQFLSRCMLYDLFNTVLRVASHHHLDLESVLGPDTYLFLSRSHQTIEALFEALARACENLASHIRTGSPTTTRIVGEALRIIRERHTDASFGAETLAEELGVTVPHLSRTFKKARAETISEHVWRLRFERAKTLLEESHAPINEIASAVGYADISAFIRRFRREAGISPGRYRQRL